PVRGQVRYGVGDDWPLWVPENRRQTGGTKGRDHEFLRQSIANGFGGTNRPPGLPAAILPLRLPEILASTPHAPDYQPNVHQILTDASQQLEENDRRFFSR